MVDALVESTIFDGNFEKILRFGPKVGSTPKNIVHSCNLKSLAPKLANFWSALIFSDPTADGYPDPVQMEEARQREVIFRIERYGIVVFAIFFVVFNAYYWIHLLRSL